MLDRVTAPVVPFNFLGTGHCLLASTTKMHMRCKHTAFMSLKMYHCVFAVGKKQRSLFKWETLSVVVLVESLHAH